MSVSVGLLIVRLLPSLRHVSRPLVNPDCSVAQDRLMTQAHRQDLCPEDGGGGRDTSLSDVHICFPGRGKILFSDRLLQVGHLLKCTTPGWGDTHNVCTLWFCQSLSITGLPWWLRW